MSAPTTTAPPGAPGPTLSGIPSNCNNYYMLKSGDSCSSVEDQFFITDTQFHAWNPAISADCSENFWLGMLSLHSPFWKKIKADVSLFSASQTIITASAQLTTPSPAAHPHSLPPLHLPCPCHRQSRITTSFRIVINLLRPKMGITVR